MRSSIFRRYFLSAKRKISFIDSLKKTDLFPDPTENMHKSAFIAVFAVSVFWRAKREATPLARTEDKSHRWKTTFSYPHFEAVVTVTVSETQTKKTRTRKRPSREKPGRHFLRPRKTADSPRHY